jgi:hypothetical protein
MSLRSFLIEFDTEENIPSVCAVTARDESDALTLIRDTYRPEGVLPDPTTMEQHTPEAIQSRIGRFDFGMPVTRGVWYPHIDNP